MCVPAEVKEKEFKFEKFIIDVTREKIEEDASGNFYKTIRLFRSIGVDLLASGQLQEHKDFVAAAVSKRNNIVHHNDDAGDMSFLDVSDWIGRFKVYSTVIFEIVSNDPHVAKVPVRAAHD